MFINVLCYSESHENAQVAMFEPVVRVSSVDVFEQRWIIVNTWSGYLFSGWNGGMGRDVCDVHVCVLYRLKTLIIPRLQRFDLFIVHQMIFSHAQLHLACQASIYTRFKTFMHTG